MRQILLHFLSFSLVVALFSISLNARLETRTQKEAVPAVSTPVFSINIPVFKTLQADLIWVSVLLNYGENKRLGIHDHDSILMAGQAISRADPHFYQNYDHVPALYFGPRALVSFDEILEISEFQAEGAEHFEHDSTLLLSASMNFVGYGGLLTEEQRLRGYYKAIDYLKKAINRDPDNPELYSVLEWFNSRVSKMARDRNYDSEKLATILWHTRNERIRKRLLESFNIDDTLPPIPTAIRFQYLRPNVALTLRRKELDND